MKGSGAKAQYGCATFLREEENFESAHPSRDVLFITRLLHQRQAVVKIKAE